MSQESSGTKKSLAAGVLGVGAVGGAGALFEGERDTGALQDVSEVLVFAYDYSPGLSFEVINRLQQQTVDSILGQTVGDDGDPVVSDPTEYNGYVIQYQSDDDGLGEYTLIFVRDDTLETGSTNEFDPGDAAFFNAQVNLLQAGLNGGDDEETTTEEDEETTPEDDETTPEADETTPEGNETTPEADETTPEDTTPEAEDTTPPESGETTPEGTAADVVVETTTPGDGGG